METETKENNVIVYEKYFNVMAKISVMQRNATNPFTKSKYAPLSQIINEVQPLLKEEKLVLKFDFEMKEGGFYDATATIINISDGGFIAWRFSIPHDETQKNKTQGFGSTMTYAQRYMYAIVFQISFDNDDPDAQKKGNPVSTKNIDKAKLEETRKKIEACKTIPELTTLYKSLPAEISNDVIVKAILTKHKNKIIPKDETKTS